MSERAPRPRENETLDERLRAVERALTGTDCDLTDVETAAERTDHLDDLERRLASVEDQVADLEAAVQAVRGYVGAVRAVNRDVERRADAALAAARAGDAAVSVDLPAENAPDEDPPRAGDPVAGDAPGGSGDSREPTTGETDDRAEPPSNSAPTDRDPESRESEDPESHQWPWEADGDEDGNEDGEGVDDAAPDHHDATTDHRDAPADHHDEGENAEPAATGSPDAPDDERPPEPDPDGAPVARPSSPAGRDLDGDFEWPPGEGLDVDRAQPWSVPDVPPADAPEEERSLLERIRESL